MTLEHEITPIRFIRNLKGWNQKSMADFLGITQPSYSLIDRGATKVKDDFRIKICQEFGVDVEIFTTQIPFSEWFRFVNPDKNKEEKLQKDTGHLNAIKIIEEEEEVNKRNNAQEILLRIENEQLREENETKQKTIEKLRKELIEMADVAQCLREELRKIMSPEKLIPN